MIEAFQNLFRVCYENTGVPFTSIYIDSRIYDALIQEIAGRSIGGTPSYYPRHIELDSVMIHAKI